MKKQIKQKAVQVNMPKKTYVPPRVTSVQIDQEISLVMSSESQIPPPEFIRLMF